MIEDLLKTVLAAIGAVVLVLLLLSGVLYWVDQFRRIPVQKIEHMIDGKSYSYPHFPPAPAWNTKTKSPVQ